MKELSLGRMENIKVGDSMDCAAAAMALFGVAVGIMFLPACGRALIAATGSI